MKPKINLINALRGTIQIGPPGGEDNNLIRANKDTRNTPINRSNLESFSTPAGPDKGEGTFLRFWSDSILNHISLQASSDFIPGLGNNFLSELAGKQKDSSFDNVTKRKIKQLDNEIHNLSQQYRVIQKRMTSDADNYSLKLDLKRILQQIRTKDLELWTRYLKARIKNTQTSVNLMGYENEPLKSAVLKACDVQNADLEWNQKASKFDDQASKLNIIDTYDQALKNHQDYLAWYKETLVEHLKLDEKVVETEVKQANQDFNTISSIINYEKNLSIIFQEVMLNAYLTTLYSLKDLDEVQKRDALNELANGLFSGKLGAEFLREFLKLQDNQDPSQIKDNYIKKLTTDSNEQQKLINWIFQKLNHSQFLVIENPLPTNQDSLPKIISRAAQRISKLPIAGEFSRKLYKIIHGTDYDRKATEPPKNTVEEIERILNDDKKGASVLKLINDTMQDTAKDFDLASISLATYVENFSIPRHLYKMGILKSNLASNQSDTILGTLIPDKLEIVNEFFGESIRQTKIQRLISTHGTHMPNLFENKGGHVFVAQDNLAILTARLFKEAQTWYEDFNNQISEGQEIFRNPLDFKSYFDAYRVKQSLDAKGNPNFDQFTNNYLADQLPEQIAISQTQSWIDACGYDDMPPEIFWGSKLIAKIDNLSRIFKDNSLLKETFDEFEKEFNALSNHDLSLMDDKNYNIIFNSFIKLEAMLRSLAHSTNPAQVLANAFNSVIFPDRKNKSGSQASGYDFMAQVMLVQLLTKEMIGKGLYDSINWKVLYNASYINENKDFLKNWQKYKSNSYDDQANLMKLRNSWYDWIKKHMSTFDEITRYVDSGKIQEVAKKILSREFISYEGRTNIKPNWQEIFKNNLEF